MTSLWTASQICLKKLNSNGLDPETQMGPLAHDRRVEAIEGFVSDAVSKGAKIRTGGNRIGNEGYFFEPTVYSRCVPLDARMMNEEPFGPVAPMTPFSDFDSAIEEANRLDYGLASYAIHHLLRLRKN